MRLLSLLQCASFPSRLQKFQIRPYSASHCVKQWGSCYCWRRSWSPCVISPLPCYPCDLHSDRFWSSVSFNGTGIPAGSSSNTSLKNPSNFRRVGRLLRHVLHTWQLSYLDTHPDPGNVWFILSWFCKQLQGVQVQSIEAPMIYWYLLEHCFNFLPVNV